ncbi:hypothetical protein QJS10_CPA06g01070 [Acorus calamus]|uniref:Uncharacterized protein n=1 Tax=Acorus calamus TaxID=4465 RepID=A0AAV9EJQ9_ACOCL|nr:hypothetical protein QJS10_CPA06g01070 [Acorus calamus]
MRGVVKHSLQWWIPLFGVCSNRGILCCCSRSDGTGDPSASSRSDVSSRELFERFNRLGLGTPVLGERFFRLKTLPDAKDIAQAMLHSSPKDTRSTIFFSSGSLRIVLKELEKQHKCAGRALTGSGCGSGESFSGRSLMLVGRAQAGRRGVRV